MSLPRAPCECFYSCFMVRETISWLRNNRTHLIIAEDSSPHSRVYIPNAEEIIITTASKLLSIGAPFKSANLLPVSLICAHNALISWDSDVIVMNLRINWSAGQNAAMRWIPGKGANSAIVLIFEAFYPLELIRIPEMHLLAGSTDCKDVARTRHPCNWCYYVSIVLSIKELFDISSNGIPEVYSLSQTHSKNIVLTPIQQVKIVIVNNVGSIKNLFGELRDAPDCLLLLLSFLLS